MKKPRWIIDDTSKPGRIFCEHTEEPRLIGELLTPDQLTGKHWAIAAPGLWLSKIRWLSNYRIYEEQDMYDSLEAAFKAHEVATGRPVSPERLQPAPAHP
jgi:hypothetical protein